MSFRRNLFTSAAGLAMVVSLAASAQTVRLPGTAAPMSPSVAKGVQPAAKLDTLKASQTLDVAFGGYRQGVPVQKATCLGADRARDAVSSQTAGNLKITTLRCALAVVDGVEVANARISFTELASSGAGGRVRLSPGTSRDCDATFRVWQGQASMKAFEAAWNGSGLYCRAVASAITPSHIGQLNMSAQPLFDQINNTGDGVYAPRVYHERKIDGLVSVDLFPTAWAKEYLGTSNSLDLVAFSEGPRSETTAYIQVLKGKALGNGMGAPDVTRDCRNWKASSSSVAVYAVPVSVKAVPAQYSADYADATKGLKAPYVISGALSAAQLADIRAKTGNDPAAYLRVVLTRDALTAPAYGCAARPSPMLRIDFGPTPSQTFLTNMQTQAAKEQAFKAWAEQQYAAAKAAQMGASPAKISVISYIPRHGGSGVMVAAPAQGPGGTFVSNFQLSDMVPWPKGLRNWKEGCTFTTYGLSDAMQKGKSWVPDSVWEAFTETMSILSSSWAFMKDIYVSAFANLITFGQCPANFPGQPQEKQAKACKYLKTATKTGMNMAMASAGIPPDIPSANDVAEDGAEYLATQAVDYAFEQAAGTGVSDYTSSASEIVGQQAVDGLTDLARQQAIQQVKSQITSAAGLSRCPFPAANAQEAKEKGYAGWNPLTQCGYDNHSLASLGTFAKQAAGDDDHAVVWLNVAANPGANGRGKVYNITVENGRIAYPASFPASVAAQIDAYNKNGQLKLFHPVHLSIDSGDFDADGMKIPVTLGLDRDDWAVWKMMIQKAQVCQQNAFYEGCVETMAIHYRNQLLANPQPLRVTGSYRWTNDASVTSYCADFQTSGSKAYCVGFDPTVTSDVVTVTQVLNRTWGNGYGIPDYSNTCPGFAMMKDPDTGLPVLDTTWKAEDLK